MRKEHILSEIARTAAENGGKPLGRTRFERETGIKESDWSGRFWTRWSDAVREAGFEPNEMQSAFTDDFLLGKLIDLIVEFGKFPTNAELRLAAKQRRGFPSHNTFVRFGSKAELAGRIVEYCRAHPELTDVAVLCSEHCRPIDASEPQPKRVDPPDDIGVVYLVKAGKYYKIGRSTAIDRRFYELKIQLPEKPKLIHQIRTDDPVGIEAYWHNRFKERHLNGEWFSLSRLGAAARLPVHLSGLGA